MIPEQFKERMEMLLGEEYLPFLQSYEQENYSSLRLNTRKTNKEVFLSETDFSLEPVLWCDSGFYYRSEDKPGGHPFHAAGVYYIQEASAMAPVTYLSPKPGEKILDLCAAPGGKSTQIACELKGEGLLMCNEPHPKRAKILSENIERMGIDNALVTNETPQRLAAVFPSYFDRILVDAPCSGEGMFRKNEVAQTEWSLENVVLCAKRQAEILDCAKTMLKPGGRLVYSTCTFSPKENEETIGNFIKTHSDFSLVETKKWEGMAEGVPEWMEEPNQEIKKTIRLWPHKIKGEGHYIAVLEKKPTEENNSLLEKNTQKGLSQTEVAEYLSFSKEVLLTKLSGTYLKFGEQLYLAPKELPSIHKLKVVRPGLHLGTIKKNRFLPSHALALFLEPNQVQKSLILSPNSEEIKAYLRGETFPYEGENGWYLICVGEAKGEAYTIGWGKLSGGIIKNHYPKGLRKNF
jgi:NOL1/NOP2/sun family putative RNA methylase